MTGIITILHVIVCLAIILIVLLQSSKGGDFGGVFGVGGGSGGVFGGRGAGSFMAKVTTVIAIIFMLTSFTLGI